MSHFCGCVDIVSAEYLLDVYIDRQSLLITIVKVVLLLGMTIWCKINMVPLWFKSNEALHYSNWLFSRKGGFSFPLSGSLVELYGFWKKKSFGANSSQQIVNFGVLNVRNLWPFAACRLLQSYWTLLMTTFVTFYYSNKPIKANALSHAYISIKAKLPSDPIKWNIFQIKTEL